MNDLPKPFISFEMRSRYPDFFAKFPAKSPTWTDAPPVRKGENGEVVLDFGQEKMLATTNGGKTWKPYTGKRLWSAGFGPYRIGNELVTLEGGASLRRSTDGGITWSDPELITPAQKSGRTAASTAKWRGPAVFSVEVTRKGRIIIPEDYITAREGPDANVLFVNTSGDGGRTWQRSHIIEPAYPLPNAPEGFGENAVVELSDSRLWMVFRTLYGRLWQCVSEDEGLTWGPPTSTGLASPISNVKAVRVPGTNSIVLFWNFAKPGPTVDFSANPGIYRPRAPLVFAVSHDDCKSWSEPTVIYDGMGIYPTISFGDEEMYVLFNANPDPKIGSGASCGLQLAVYSIKDVLDAPVWTEERMIPYIDAGLVDHWMILRTSTPRDQTTITI